MRGVRMNHCAVVLLLLCYVWPSQGVCPEGLCNGNFEEGGDWQSCITTAYDPGSDSQVTDSTLQGFQAVPYSTSLRATDSYPAIPAPGQGIGGGATGALRLDRPGSAALIYTFDVVDPQQLLTFEWYLCGAEYSGQPTFISLDDAHRLTTSLRKDCLTTCNPWCKQASCSKACCPVQADVCSECPGTCNTLCGFCQQGCAGLQAKVQIARVDLYVSTQGKDALRDQLSQTVLQPGIPVCASTASCNQTILDPTTLGSFNTQCGWQDFSLPLNKLVGFTVGVVFRALDTRPPNCPPLAFAIDNISARCGPRPPRPPPASSAKPSPSPIAPATPPPLSSLPPTPALGCYDSPCSDGMAGLKVSQGTLGSCLTSMLDSPGSSGFVPFYVSQAFADQDGPPPPPGVTQGEVAAVQLENMGAAALVYRTFVSSKQSVLQMQYYLCSSAFTMDDLFSLQAMSSKVLEGNADCSRFCQSSCTACSIKCCTPGPCNQECMMECCFSCWAKCNGRTVPLQTARIDLYVLDQRLMSDQHAWRKVLFRTDEPTCRSSDGCITLLPTETIGVQSNQCTWQTFAQPMEQYEGQHIAVVFRALDSRARLTQPLQFAVSAVSCSCPSPSQPPPSPPPMLPPSPNMPPAPPSPPFGQCVASTCDGTFEAGLGSCVSTLVQPADHPGGFKVTPFSVSMSNLTVPVVPRNPAVPASAYMAQLINIRPGAAALVFTKFISSPLEKLSFRWFLCTRANLTDGPYSYDEAKAEAMLITDKCNSQCEPFCAQGACNQQCCNPAPCSPACIIDCYNTCGTCQQQCSNTTGPMQAFRVDLYRVPWPGAGLDSAAVFNSANQQPCQESLGCLKPIVDYSQAVAASCKGWKQQTVSMEPYVGMTVALVVRAVDMHSTRAFQMSAAVDDIYCSCWPPPPAPLVTSPTPSPAVIAKSGRRRSLEAQEQQRQQQLVQGVQGQERLPRLTSLPRMMLWRMSSIWSTAVSSAGQWKQAQHHIASSGPGQPDRKEEEEAVGSQQTQLY